ncbi:MAG: LD-carboxypeptidase [Lentisphaeria bacterium]|nr:LD-carboxypeptidase [Lentisphaeria bacterium]
MNRPSKQSEPKTLRKNDLFPDGLDCLGIVAPAGPVSAEKFEQACRFLTSLGLRLVTGSAVTRGDKLSYVSAPAEDRADDLNALIRNPKVQAIYCLRGGYGSVQLLDLLDWTELKRRKLPVVGYSDITSLHAAMRTRRAGLPVSACMALHLEEDARTTAFRRDFKRAWGVALHRTGPFRRIARLESYVPETESAEGPLFCGNLATLASLCGTPWLPKPKREVIFLEDIAEPVRKLDRTLTQLLLSGFFTDCAAVVFGDFRQCGDRNEREELFRRFTAKIGKPVFAGLRYGHCPRSVSLVGGEPAVIRDGALYLRDPFSGEKS